MAYQYRLIWATDTYSMDRRYLGSRAVADPVQRRPRSAPTLGCRSVRGDETANVAVPMRDGVTLCADVYRPTTSAAVPVILTRTQYGKEAVQVHPLRYQRPDKLASHCYLVVIQDTQQLTQDSLDIAGWLRHTPYRAFPPLHPDDGAVAPYFYDWIAHYTDGPSVHAGKPVL